jgi:hypothetical protein
VSVEENARERFGEMVGKIDGYIDPFKTDEIAFHPFAESKIFNINMKCARCWFLGIAHGGALVIVLVGNSSSLVQYIEVP